MTLEQVLRAAERVVSNVLGNGIEFCEVYEDEELIEEFQILEADFEQVWRVAEDMLHSVRKSFIKEGVL